MYDSQHILVINCGSSSLKFSVIDIEKNTVLLNGIADQLHDDHGFINYSFHHKKYKEALSKASHSEATKAIIKLLEQFNLMGSIKAVGHRVVHGGELFADSIIIDQRVIEEIRNCTHLAPLHNPANLVGILNFRKILPDIPQVAVFDTAFHQTMCQEHYLYAIPYNWYTRYGLRRYGMHGTSYRYVWRKLYREYNIAIEQKILIAHLGNGASVCAIQYGQSVNTTMGLTPLEGLVMGTRSGDIDPNVFSFMAKNANATLEQTTQALNEESGLLGVSGLSNDCRVLEQAMNDGHLRAKLALDLFVNRLAQKIGALMIDLEGVGVLVLTGGIGENSYYIRRQLFKKLTCIGLEIDDRLNKDCVKGKEGLISTDDSCIQAYVLSTNEELMIAEDTHHLVNGISD